MNFTQSHQSQLIYLRKWLGSSLTLNALKMVPIEEFYKEYRRGLIQRTGSLGVKPKTFSKELRLHFEKDIENQRVRFSYYGQPFIEGVTLKQEVVNFQQKEVNLKQESL